MNDTARTRNCYPFGNPSTGKWKRFGDLTRADWDLVEEAARRYANRRRTYAGGTFYDEVREVRAALAPGFEGLPPEATTAEARDRLATRNLVREARS